MNCDQPEFLPMSRAEMRQAGWTELDVLLITGDCYVDHPSFGAAVIGRVLVGLGYRVGIVAQPDWRQPSALETMGRPRLACAVTSGNLDSMVNLYTAGRRLRREDAFSENGVPGRRPPHALTVYSQLAKRAFPGIPVVAGGIEASLRRIAHYDYWQDKLRPGVLLDSKADVLVYGMGELPVETIFARLSTGEPLTGIRGTAVLLGKNAAASFCPDNYQELPSWKELQADRDALMTSTRIVESQMNPFAGTGLFQRYDDRILAVEPPPPPLTEEQIDKIHDLPFSNRPHPAYKQRIPAFQTVANSIPAVRGCPGGCAFCGLVSHQGRTVVSRSHDSILREVGRMSKRKGWRGTISDVGGAAGNIYGSAPSRIDQCSRCRRPSCLYPSVCDNFQADGKSLLALLRKIRRIPGVRHVHVNSGIRLDLALRQRELLKELVRHHVSGHLKVAPEHLHPAVLRLMRKNRAEDFHAFMEIFERESRAVGKEQYLVPLFISNFPGCTEEDMTVVDDFLERHRWSPRQVQDYIPLPMTMGAAMYYSGKDPDGNPIQVNRGLKERRPQIQVLKKRRNRQGIKPDMS